MGHLIAAMAAADYWAGLALWMGACAYILVAAWCVARLRPAKASAGPAPALTVLKPLCGHEPGLEEHLASFCAQDYSGPLQILFGVRSDSDPALPVVRRLIERFPDRDIGCVIDPAVAGPNLKVSNLANMEAAARHPLLAVSDSDVRIGPGALERAVQPLTDERVGAVTCLYRGAPAQSAPGAAQRLAALHINGWFLPSAVIAARLWPLDTCYGPLTIIRRSVLETAGGFRAMAHKLADDHELGQLTVAQGRRVALAPVVVETVTTERSLRELLSHELRWNRTSLATTPDAYLAYVFTCALPAVVALMGPRPSTLAAAVVLVLLRTALLALIEHRTGDGPARRRLASPVSLAVRETLCFGVWMWAYLGETVSWRGVRFIIRGGATLEALSRAPLPAELPG